MVYPKSNVFCAASSKINISDRLAQAAEEQWYQTLENYADDIDYSKKDLIDITVDHLLYIISELDDDEDFLEYRELAEREDPSFVKALRQFVKMHNREWE